MALAIFRLFQGQIGGRNDRIIIGYVAIAVFAMVASLGFATPLGTFLYQAVPGYQTLRILHRWFLLALMAIALVAAWGSVFVFNRLGRRPQILLFSLITLWFIVEQFPTPIAVYRMYPPEEHPEIEWLKQQPGEFPILELPIFPGLYHQGNDTVEGRRLYFSTFHWKKRINGAFSPYRPSDYTTQAELFQRIGSDPSALTFIEIVGGVTSFSTLKTSKF